MPDYAFKIDAARIKPLLQRDLYRDPDTLLREVAQNAIDAIRRRALIQPGFDPVKDGDIVFQKDDLAGTITISDNGVGLSKKTITEIFRWYGRTDKSENEIGGFGLGVKSIFALADSFTVHTRTKNDEGSDETHLIYVTLNGLSFQSGPPKRSDYGTTINIPAKNLDIKELVEYCQFVQIPIYVASKTKRKLISQKTPWGDAKRTVRIPCDGFEIHLRVSEDSTGTNADSFYRGHTPSSPRLFTDGIYVCDFPQRKVARNVPDDIAVNLTKRGTLNLTISRDLLIEDAKYDALMKQIPLGIAKFAESKMRDWKIVTRDFDALGLATWIARNADFPKRLLSTSTRSMLDSLGTRVYVVTGTQRNGRPLCRAPWAESCLMSEMFLRRLFHSTLYEAIGKMISSIEHAVQTKGRITVVYKVSANQKAMRDLLKEANVPTLEVEEAPKRRTVFKYGTRMTLELSEILKGAIVDLVIFPQQTDEETVKQVSAKYDCTTVRLRDDEGVNLPNDLIDFRQPLLPHGMLHGEEVTPDTSLVGIKLAPLSIYRHAKLASQLPILFPRDKKSLRIFQIHHQMKYVNAQDCIKLLTTIIPPPARDNVSFGKLGEFVRSNSDPIHMISEMVDLATLLDWTNPYACVIFDTLARLNEPGILDAIKRIEPGSQN